MVLPEGRSGLRSVRIAGTARTGTLNLVMEHRWGQRVPVAIEVRLACHPFAIGSGCIRDASMSGAFVTTALELPLLSRVRVDIVVGSRNGRTQLRRLEAHVVRRDAAGIGVEWLTLDPAVLRDLLACALGHEVAAWREQRSASSSP